jgi:hypothetical protein
MINETRRRVTGTHIFYRRREISNRAGAYTCKTKRKDRFGMAKLWSVSSLQTNHEDGWSSLHQLLFHHSVFGAPLKSVLVSPLFILDNVWYSQSQAWWNMTVGCSTPNLKALSSVTLLATWKIWNECNTRIFRNNHTSLQVNLDRAKRKTRSWVSAGAKYLGEIHGRVITCSNNYLSCLENFYTILS